MMARAVIAMALSLWSVTASAQSVKLQNHEIEALLSGNTAVGTLDGTSYRQYFDPDGTTILAQEGQSKATGQWRVQDEELQSIWSPSDIWEGRFVMDYNGGLYWVSKTTPPTPFTVLENQRLVVQ